MTTTEKNLRDLAEVLRALSESGLWAPDRDLFYDLPDPGHATVAPLVDSLAGIIGEDIEIIDTWSVQQWGTTDAAPPVDADAAAALLRSAGAAGAGDTSRATLRVGDPVPGDVWVTAHAIHGDVRALSGEREYADALARLVRGHWERVRPAFVDDVTGQTLRYVTEYLEDLEEVIDGLDRLAARLVHRHRAGIDAACVLSEFDRGLERGDGRGIDVDGAEFGVDSNGEVTYRDWDLVVSNVADAQAKAIQDAWEQSRS